MSATRFDATPGARSEYREPSALPEATPEPVADGVTPWPAQQSATEPEPPAPAVQPVSSNEAAIWTLLNGLCDRMILPDSQITPLERRFIDDLMTGLARRTGDSLRARLAVRTARLGALAPRTNRFLAGLSIDVARPILETSDALSDVDLAHVIDQGDADHWLCIASRDRLPRSMVDRLIATGNAGVVRKLVANDKIELSMAAHERLADHWSGDVPLVRLLLSRTDMAPHVAFRLFWHVPGDLRSYIVKRFTMERQVAADALTEAAIDGLLEQIGIGAELARRPGPRDDAMPQLLLRCAMGEDRTALVHELAGYAHLKRATARKLVADRGGEALALYCKATGIGRSDCAHLVALLERSRSGWDESLSFLEPIIALYDTVSRDRADVVLRYWDADEEDEAQTAAPGCGVDGAVDGETATDPARDELAA